MSQFTIKRFSLVTLLSIAGLLVSTCTQNKEQPATAQAPTRIVPPQVTVLASLPDSSKPKVTLLAEMPKPVTPPVSAPPKVYSFIDPVTNLPLTSETEGLGLFTNFTTDDGLAIDQLDCSAMDKMGAIWFGANGGGVSRYDGKKFTTYTMKQGLAEDIVRCITINKSGNIWVGTDGGASRFDGRTFTNYTTKQGLVNNIVFSILEDKKGNIWFGTNDGASCFDGKTFTSYTTKEGLVNNQVSTIIQDKTGNIWFGTYGGGVSYYNGKKFINYTTREGLADNSIYRILEDKAGSLWFATGNGLSHFDGKKFTNYRTAQGLAHNDLMYIAEDKIGNLWIATFGGGVSRYDGKRFTNFTTTQGLANNYVYSILEDKTGSIWFSTNGGGVSRYDGKSCLNYTTQQGLGNSFVSSVMEDKTGNLWFGTVGGGVSRYNGKSFTTYSMQQGLAYNMVYASVEDKQGDIWFATVGNGGVSRFDGKRFTNYTTAQGLANNYVISILNDKQGNLWFGTTGGLSQYDGKRFINYTTAQGLTDNTIQAIVEDKRGNIWFSTANGASCFDGKRFTNYTTAQGLGNNSVGPIVEDKTGTIWFGTGDGLSRFDGKSFANYTTAQGLPGECVTNILIDSHSNILIGIPNGICTLTGFTRKATGQTPAKHVSPQNTLSNEALKHYTPQIDVYTTATGYPITRTSFGQNTLFEDSKGRTWIATSADKTGLVRFDYTAIHKNQNPPTLVLQTIKINNETVCWHDLLPASSSAEWSKKSDSLATPANVTEEVTALGRALRETERDSLHRTFSGVKFDSIAPWYPIPVNLVLPYQHNSVSFAFNAIETSRNFMIKYQYKLDGYDEDWSSIKDEASATFGNLFEGTYTFRVKARSPEGIWCQPLTYTFTIQPPWWRTWWAYLLYALAAGGAIWAFVAYRSRALRRENRLLEEKVSLRTNQLQKKSSELETSLTNLKATQTQLVQKEKMASLGELTAGIAHEIQNPLNFVNNFSELSSELVEELEEEHQKPQRDDELEVELLTDLKDNLTKILHHGNRASSIVKGMLEHARTSTGEILPTDLNKLTEEYLRLAYQGLRAKDKQFNCALETHFDASIGQVSVMPQEIGRVLLNLFNNAFYAVHQRQILSGEDYQPTVSVTTSRVDEQVAITVRDNGTGMSDSVKAKIFQPFFTTKPTGQGTGLGLSLSYDIITKGHGGELTVSSVEGEGTTFVIQLPITHI